jgi:phospholipase A2
MEFSPYEIGLPKYGTFMKAEHFGSKFFMGQLVRKHPEPPLHFLQGKQKFK